MLPDRKCQCPSSLLSMSEVKSQEHHSLIYFPNCALSPSAEHRRSIQALTVLPIWMCEAPELEDMLRSTPVPYCRCSCWYIMHNAICQNFSSTMYQEFVLPSFSKLFGCSVPGKCQGKCAIVFIHPVWCIFLELMFRNSATRMQT